MNRLVALSSKHLSVTDRLHFIDALRAWAILMMLQGHFVAGLLSDSFQDKEMPLFAVWSYFRGITAPVFFAVSGFIFAFLLVRNSSTGIQNPRVKKGAIRGIQLMAIGYFLQIRFALLFQGTLHPSYNIVHVLQCLGVSILIIILLYLLCYRLVIWVFAGVLCTITLVLFLFKNTYENWDLAYLPEFIANYFTNAHGSVFTLFPWVGFATFGAFLAVLFAQNHQKKHFYAYAIAATAVLGYLLVFQASGVISAIGDFMGMAYTEHHPANSYLFERLGAVLLMFAFFIAFRSYLNQKILLTIGQKTLPIYIVHSVILYGSITGHGLTRYYYHALSPTVVLFGAVLFVFGICAVVIGFEKYRALLNYKNDTFSTE